MNKPRRITWLVVATVALAVVMTAVPSLLAGEPAVSGRFVDGFRVLLDKGFTRMSNMRYGIVDWQERKYAVAK